MFLILLLSSIALMQGYTRYTFGVNNNFKISENKLRIRGEYDFSKWALSTDDRSSIPSSSINTESEVRAKFKTNIEVAVKNEIAQVSNNGVITTESFLEADKNFFDSLKSKRSYLSIITERIMQSIDDFQLSLSLKDNYSYINNAKTSEGDSKETIVILGTGWGSHSFLKTIDGTKYNVKIVSPRSFFTFTPMVLICYV